MTEGAFASDKAIHYFPHAFIFKNNPKHFDEISNKKTDGVKNFNTNIQEFTTAYQEGAPRPDRKRVFPSYSSISQIILMSWVPYQIHFKKLTTCRAKGVYSSRNITDYFKLRKLHRECFLFNFGKHSINPRRVIWYKFIWDEIFGQKKNIISTKNYFQFYGNHKQGSENRNTSSISSSGSHSQQKCQLHCIKWGGEKGT